MSKVVVVIREDTDGERTVVAAYPNKNQAEKHVAEANEVEVDGVVYYHYTVKLDKKFTPMPFGVFKVETIQNESDYELFRDYESAYEFYRHNKDSYCRPVIQWVL